MINWILGAAIVGFTLFIIIKNVKRLQKGEDTCGSCSGCSDKNCSSYKG